MKGISKPSLPGKSKLPLVVTIGVFDGVHRGHRHLIRATIGRAHRRSARSLAITFWPHPQKILNRHYQGTLMTLESRLRVLRSLGIDAFWVIPAHKRLLAKTGEEFMGYVSRHVPICEFVVGEDFKCGAGAGWGVDELKEFSRKRGIKTRIIPKRRIGKYPVSSSRIRALIHTAKFREAGRLMGRPFVYSSVVVRGKGVGRTLGFPTANLAPADLIMPPAGVYAAFVRCGRRWRSAAVNIGTRPTVSSEKKAVCEVHIIGWKKDITGRKIDVVFLKKLRNEKKFASKNLLIQAILKDIRTITTRYSSPSKISHNLL